MNAALELAAYGWRVLPLIPRGKRPLVKKWQDVATTDEDQICIWWDQWPDANVAVAMGQQSGIIDIECDSEDAEKLFNELFEGYEIFTPCFQSRRGKHRLFKWTSQFPHASNKATWSVGEIDFKIGGGDKGSYCVFPPSIHPDTGKKYEWLIHPDECELAEIPDEVIARIAVYAQEGTLKSEPQGRSQEHWDNIKKGVNEGGRNNACASYAGKLITHLANPFDNEAVSMALLMLKQWNQTNVPPLDDKELTTTFDSVLRRHRSRHTTQSTAVELQPQAELNYETGQVSESQWKLISIKDGDVAKYWKLFSPQWSGYVVLEQNDVCSSQKIVAAAAVQKDVGLPFNFNSIWRGTKKAAGLFEELIGEEKSEKVSQEENTEWIVARALWSEQISKAKEEKEPNTRGTPAKIKKIGVVFQFNYVLHMLQQSNKEITRRQLVALLKKVCAENPYRLRIDGKQMKFKVIDDHGLTLLENITLGEKDA